MAGPGAAKCDDLSLFAPVNTSKHDLNHKPSRDQAVAYECYAFHMTVPFAPNRFRAYEIEVGAGGQRLGCKFLLDDGSLLYVHESQITAEIESLMASLGSPTKGLRHGHPVATNES